MRISDCSSDVCSSDLTVVLRLQKMIAVWISSASIRSRSVSRLPRSDVLTRNCSIFSFRLAGRATSIIFGFDRNLSASFLIGGGIDRKSVVEGKSVSGRVGHGGRRILNKKNKKI